jgi:hypothetical protein
MDMLAVHVIHKLPEDGGSGSDRRDMSARSMRSGCQSLTVFPNPADAVVTLWSMSVFAADVFFVCMFSVVAYTVFCREGFCGFPALQSFLQQVMTATFTDRMILQNDSHSFACHNATDFFDTMCRRTCFS